MKRTVCALMTAAAVVGCSSTRSVTPRGHSDMGFSHHLPTPSENAPKVASNGEQAKEGEIVQVGYNTGYGAIQNRMYKQRVARAVPSHGGSLPPSAAAARAGMQMASMHGMPPGGARPGMVGPNCPPQMRGMAGPGGPGLRAGMGLGPRFRVGRSQVHFVRPEGMTIAWQSPVAGGRGGFTKPQLTVPDDSTYNFPQAAIYRLKITNIQNRDVTLYPTLEIYPGNVKIDPYLAHNAIPIEFSDEDFDQVQAGNFVTKVIYLPDPEFQELAIAPSVETLVSTRLEPGVDPVQEAHRRGSILAVVRMGSVNLELSASPPLFRAPPAPPAPAGKDEAAKKDEANWGGLSLFRVNRSAPEPKEPAAK